MRLTLDDLTPDQQDNALSHYIEGVFLGTPAMKRAGIAVSGGGDSMALLHAVWQYCSLCDFPIEVATVNHGLRAAAAKEAAMVADYCEKIGVPHTTLQWDGAAAAGNIAAAGRDARYHLIGTWAQARGIDCVFLGHTKDDVAETFLMRLARDAGVDGLAAMASHFEREGVVWARPLLHVGRDLLRSYLRRHDVAWVDDPTNEDERYVRTKARKILSELAPLGITVDTLSTVASLQSNAKDTLNYYTHQEADRWVVHEHGDILIQHRVDPPLEHGAKQRLLVAALSYVGGAKHAPRRVARTKLEIALSENGKHTLAGCIVTQNEKHTRVAREFNAVKDKVAQLGDIWDGRWEIIGPTSKKYNVRALGESLKNVPDWRDVGLPRASLMASPAVFDGETLISAPVAGYNNGFDARIVTDFSSFLLSR